MMSFDWGKFAGSLGSSLMGMNGGGGGGGMGGGTQMAPLDLSFLQALMGKPHAYDLLQHYDQQPQERNPGMQMFMGQNHLTGSY